MISGIRNKIPEICALEWLEILSTSYPHNVDRMEQIYTLKLKMNAESTIKAG